MSNVLTPAERAAWRKLYRAGYRTEREKDSGLWVVTKPEVGRVGGWWAYRDLAVASVLNGGTGHPQNGHVAGGS